MKEYFDTVEPIDILAFSPHPDDAELGCGGTLILSAKKELRTVIADLTNGECSSRGTSDQREEEKLISSKIIGLTDRFSLGLPDTKIGLEQSHLEKVVDVIRKTKPTIVLAPYWKDRHPDHENAGKLVQSACFYAGVASIGKGRPYRPAEVYYYMIHTTFEPSFVVDISSVWEQKSEVLQAYRTQFFNKNKEENPTSISNPEFISYIESRAIYFGAMTGVKYGEPFFCRGPVPATALPGLDSPRTDSNIPNQYKSV